jgi:hypothetical protein
LRFGIGTPNGEQYVGRALAARVGKSQVTAERRAREGIRRLAEMLAEDPDRCGMSRAE